MSVVWVQERVVYNVYFVVAGVGREKKSRLDAEGAMIAYGKTGLRSGLGFTRTKRCGASAADGTVVASDDIYDKSTPL